MVRFARAEGSKGSNKRTLEEPTPWSELVTQHDVKVKKKKPKRMKEDPANEESPNVLGIKDEGNIKQEECKETEKASTKSKKKKKKKDQDNLSADDNSKFIINSKGQRLKVFKDGTERTWFDLPYEENERMTRYSNMWVKREMVGELDHLQATLKDSGLGEKEMMRAMMKAKRKAHKDLRIELIYEQKQLVSSQMDAKKDDVTKKSNKVDKKVKIKKKKEKIKTEETLSQDLIVKGPNVFSKNGVSMKEKDDCQSQGQPSPNEENDSVELKDVSLGKSIDEWHTSQSDGKNWSEGSFRVDKRDSYSEKNNFFEDFEENDLMTLYEGFWVKRKSVERLNAVKAEKLQCIYAARTDGKTGEELTKGEQITLQRIMKKEKRFEHRQLTKELARLRAKREGVRPAVQSTIRGGGGGNRIFSSVRNNVSSKSDDYEVVRFDGFWVKKESADRLNKLRGKLMSEGVAEEELKQILQKERRAEERLLKNERKLVCLKCRNPGHMVSECPELTGAGEGKTNICYTCGSTEHISRECSAPRKGAEFSHATCFICGEVGHISRECPDNPRGLYPKGGACRGCGSVEHLVKDCPDRQMEYEESSIKANLIDRNAVEAIDIDEPTDASLNADSPLKKKAKAKIKVISF